MPNLNTIVGKIGGGKTSTAVSMMLEHMSKGGVVASNINLRDAPFISEIFKKAQAGFVYALKALYDWDYQEGQFIYLPDTEVIPIETSKGKMRFIPKAARFWEHIPRGKPDLHVLVFIDEAHKVWPKNAYEFMPSGDTDVVALIRHLNVELYWMSQHQEHVWIDMRRLTEDWLFVNSLKKGGLGIIARFPHGMREIFQFISLLLRLIFWPVLRLCPDYIRLRRFRSEEETSSNIYPGYPKIKRYNALVFQSYDSPVAARGVQMDETKQNDFRVKDAPKRRLVDFKKFAPLAAGIAVLFLSVLWGCARFSRPSKPPVVSSSFPAPAAVVAPLPVVSVPSTLVYSWLFSVNGSFEIGLPDGSTLKNGDVWPSGSSLLLFAVINERLILSDGRAVRLVKTAPVVVQSNSVSSIGGVFFKK
jgi:hypothetical protein